MDKRSRAIARIYGAQVTENVPLGFRLQIFLRRVMGLWPMADDSRWYKWLTISFFLLVAIIFPITIFVNIFYANSIDDAMEQCFISLTCIVNTLKAGVVYWRLHSVRELFQIHAKLLRGGEYGAKIHNRIARSNIRIHLIISFLYMSSWCNNVVQVVFFDSEKPSMYTARLSIANNNRSVYYSVLIYQIVMGFGDTLWVAMEDTFPVVLINTACGHIRQLKERLRYLGSEGDDLLFYKGVVECCECYENCLRWVFFSIYISVECTFDQRWRCEWLRVEWRFG